MLQVDNNHNKIQNIQQHFEEIILSFHHIIELPEFYLELILR